MSLISKLQAKLVKEADSYISSRVPELSGLGEKLGKRNRKIPLGIQALLLIPPVVLRVYWRLSDTGLYGRLSSLQADYMNGYYYPVVTLLLTFIILFVPSLIIMYVIAPYYTTIEDKLDGVNE